MEVIAEREHSLTIKIKGDGNVIKYHSLLDFTGTGDKVGHVLPNKVYSYMS